MKKILATILISLCLVGLVGCNSTESEPEPEHTRYTVDYCRYYTNGTVITSDGMLWGYQTDSISNEVPYDGMPVVIALDDNGTPDIIEDDIVLGLVYDIETSIYDKLEVELSEAFELNRNGNNIRIQSLKPIE